MLSKLQRLALKAERKAELAEKNKKHEVVGIIILSTEDTMIEGMRQLQKCEKVADNNFHRFKIKRFAGFRSRKRAMVYMNAYNHTYIIPEWYLAAGMNLQEDYSRKALYIDTHYPGCSMVNLIIAANTHLLLAKGLSYTTIQRKYKHYFSTVKELYMNYVSFAGKDEAKKYNIIFDITDYRKSGLGETVYQFTPPAERKVHGRAPRKVKPNDDDLW